jgi:hypothetical protein
MRLAHRGFFFGEITLTNERSFWKGLGPWQMPWRSNRSRKSTWQSPGRKPKTVSWRCRNTPLKISCQTAREEFVMRGVTLVSEPFNLET